MASYENFAVGDLSVEVNGVFIPRSPGSLSNNNNSEVQEGFLLIPGTAIFHNQGQTPMWLPYNHDNHIITVEDAESSLNNGENNNNNNYDEVMAELFDDDMTSAAPRMRPASKTAIEGLEKMRINDNRIAGHCAVCLEDLVIGAEVVRLPCSHLYHPGCIVEWLNNSNLCPVCRHQMPVVDFDLNSSPPALDLDLNCKIAADFENLNDI